MAAETLLLRSLSESCLHLINLMLFPCESFIAHVCPACYICHQKALNPFMHYGERKISCVAIDTMLFAGLALSSLIPSRFSMTASLSCLQAHQ